MYNRHRNPKFSIFLVLSTAKFKIAMSQHFQLLKLSCQPTVQMSVKSNLARQYVKTCGAANISIAIWQQTKWLELKRNVLLFLLLCMQYCHLSTLEMQFFPLIFILFPKTMGRCTLLIYRIVRNTFTNELGTGVQKIHPETERCQHSQTDRIRPLLSR